MPDPSYRLRVATSGVPLRGTPGHVLTFNADGESVSGQPGGGGPGSGLVSFNGRTDPEAVPTEGDYSAAQVVNTSAAPGDFVEQALDAIWAELHPFTIDSFDRVGATLVLVGAAIHSPAFVASYSQPAELVTLTDTEGNDDPIALPATGFASTGHSFSKTVFGESVVFTLHATRGATEATRDASISWGSNVYTGAAVDPGAYTAGFIQSLAAALKLGAGGNYPQNAAAGQSVFFCARTGFGLTVANFFFGGFPFACSRVATGVNVTINGVTEGFDVFRGDNTGLGPFTLTVQ
jgi:hypothetical protein